MKFEEAKAIAEKYTETTGKKALVIQVHDEKSHLMIAEYMVRRETIEASGGSIVYETEGSNVLSQEKITSNALQ